MADAYQDKSKWIASGTNSIASVSQIFKRLKIRSHLDVNPFTELSVSTGYYQSPEENLVLSPNILPLERLGYKKTELKPGGS